MSTTLQDRAEALLNPPKPDISEDKILLVTKSQRYSPPVQIQHPVTLAPELQMARSLCSAAATECWAEAQPTAPASNEEPAPVAPVLYQYSHNSPGRIMLTGTTSKRRRLFKRPSMPSRHNHSTTVALTTLNAFLTQTNSPHSQLLHDTYLACQEPALLPLINQFILAGEPAAATAFTKLILKLKQRHFNHVLSPAKRDSIFLNP